MTIQDLQVGDHIYFGSHDYGECYGGTAGVYVNDIVWVKVDEDNTMLAYPLGVRSCMDEKEYGSSNPYRRASGSVFFPESNLFQWLNKSGTNWFVPAGDGDCGPTYEDWMGFLSGFSEDELSLILPHQITISVPEGFKKEYGQFYQTFCLVSIPAMSEILSKPNIPSEGKLFSLRSAEVYKNLFKMSWTRTAASRNTMYYLNGVELSECRPCERKQFNPKIRLKGDALVSDTPSPEGIYEVLVSDGSKSPLKSEDLYGILS